MNRRQTNMTIFFTMENGETEKYSRIARTFAVDA